MATSATGGGGADRGVSVRGEAVSDWLAGRGIEVAAPAGAHLFADEVAESGFRLARLWHTALSARTVPAPGRIRLLVPMEGELEVSSAGWRRPEPVRPGDVALLPTSRVFALAARAPTARFEVETTLTALPSLVTEHVAEGRVLRAAAPEFRAMLTSVTTAALNSTLSPGDSGFPAFRSAVLNLVSATVFQALDVNSSGRFARTPQLYRRAVDLIAARATDPDFSVETLAHELSVSPKHLHRSFAASGATPGGEIRAARAAVARGYLAAIETGGRFTAADVAGLSGFRSARTMRAALRDR